MNLLAHHEALLIVQATAGLTIAGTTTALLASWTKLRGRVISPGIRTRQRSSRAVGHYKRNEHAERIGAELNQRGQ